MNEKIHCQTKVNVLFSSDRLLIEFLKDPYFEGRKLIIKGEALSCGFDAFPSTMKWAKPFENEIINDEQRIHIVESINKNLENCCTGFKVIWEEE